MTENDRDEMVKVIYRYRSELPLTNRNLTRRVDMAQIANWPDDVLSSSYYYIIERLKSLAQFKAQTSSLDTVDDYFDDYYLDSETFDDFLGPKEPNGRELRLKNLKKTRGI